MKLDAIDIQSKWSCFVDRIYDVVKVNPCGKNELHIKYIFHLVGK